MLSDYEKFVNTWCGENYTLCAETRRTVEIVKQKLTESPILTKLSLSDKQLQDLTPLSTLTNLTLLHLHNNQLRDLTPLCNLTNLSWLSLSDNQLRDLTPLSTLTNLSWLSLSDNQLRDLTPLSTLTNLKLLYLHNNQLRDLTPISSLTNLTDLNLENNQFQDLTPLFTLTNLTRLSLSSNRPLDLSSLTKLTYLNVRWNGVNIPQKYWFPVEQWSSKWILTESNAELRRLFIQLLGYERIAQELSAIELDRWREYSLFKIRMTKGEENIYLLKMTCPSTGHVHVLRVPPSEKAIEGITWVNWGIHPEEFVIET